MDRMQDQFSRTRLLLGDAAMATLAAARVAVFGIGGVGGHALEVLARSGVGAIDVFDGDRVCLTNVNRQALALLSTVGRLKVEVAQERVADINPACRVGAHRLFYLPENADEVDLSAFDYVVDCVDTVAAKVELACRCHALGVPLIASMGAANKLDATAFRVADVYDTQVDPLARVLRKRLRQRGVPALKVVYSEEEPLAPMATEEELAAMMATELETETAAAKAQAKEAQRSCRRRAIPASNAFVPAAAGLILGGEVVKDLLRRAGTLR